MSIEGGLTPEEIEAERKEDEEVDKLVEYAFHFFIGIVYLIFHFIFRFSIPFPIGLIIINTLGIYGTKTTLYKRGAALFLECIDRINELF
jgi:hypothetical protein